MHDAALRAGIEILLELARFTMRNVDPLGKDANGETPDSCFYYGRNSKCTLARGSFEKEEEAWIVLMKSVCRQNGYAYRLSAEIDRRCIKLANVVEIDTSNYRELGVRMGGCIGDEKADDNSTDGGDDDDDDAMFQDAVSTLASGTDERPFEGVG